MTPQFKIIFLFSSHYNSIGFKRTVIIFSNRSKIFSFNFVSYKKGNIFEAFRSETMILKLISCLNITIRPTSINNYGMLIDRFSKSQRAKENCTKLLCVQRYDPGRGIRKIVYGVQLESWKRLGARTHGKVKNIGYCTFAGDGRRRRNGKRERRFIENEVSQWEKKIKCYINTVNNYSRRECPNKVDPSTTPVEKRVSPTPVYIYNHRPSFSYPREKSPQTLLSASGRPNRVGGLVRWCGGGGRVQTLGVLSLLSSLYTYI